MDTCFQCGGKLKAIAKAGRMAYGPDEEDDELYEIPSELKISTCLDCGWLFEEEVWLKIQRAVEAQKKCAPGYRVDMLRFVDKRIRDILDRPAFYGNQPAVELVVLQLLIVREAVVRKGKTANAPLLTKQYRRFLKKHLPKTPEKLLSTEFHKLDLNEEFAPLLSDFCDVWVNAVE